MKGNEDRYIAGRNSENGPNIMFYVHGPLCVSSVDVTFALKIDCEFMNKEKYGRLRNNDQCLLVPKPPDGAKFYNQSYSNMSTIPTSTPCSYCWLMTSSSVEVQRVRASTKEHKKIHMMLKYMPREDQLDMVDFNKSYVSKTIMYNEKCPTTQGKDVPIARCFEDVLKTMNDIHCIKLLDVPEGSELTFMIKLLISAFNLKRTRQEERDWPDDWDFEDIFKDLNESIANKAGVELNTVNINEQFITLTDKIVAALKTEAGGSLVQHIKNCMGRFNMDLTNKAIAFYCIHQGGAVLSHMHFPTTNVMYTKYEPSITDSQFLDYHPHPSIFTHNDMKVLNRIVKQLKSPEGRQLLNDAKVSESFLSYLKSKCESGVTPQCNAYEEVKAILERI
ncbi:unnamed protein product [Owenia fusiformis]|uniref:Uncharacterized protein n=1 Tax=Owenia fusiformis TaxID=6347 RepID=A0A8J1T5P7_OWEFU|nr:unnamed protein product [Owenia fusiformis]